MNKDKEVILGYLKWLSNRLSPSMATQLNGADVDEYLEQQVNSVDLADVGGALPTQRDFLKTTIHWHEEYNEKGHFNIPLVHEQYEYLTWLSNRLAKVHGQ